MTSSVKRGPQALSCPSGFLAPLRDDWGPTAPTRFEAPRTWIKQETAVDRGPQAVAEPAAGLPCETEVSGGAKQAV